MTAAGTYYYQPSAGTGNLLLSNPPFIFQSMDTNQSTPAEGLPELTEKQFQELSAAGAGRDSGSWFDDNDHLCYYYEDALRIARAAYRMGLADSPTDHAKPTDEITANPQERFSCHPSEETMEKLKQEVAGYGVDGEAGVIYAINIAYNSGWWAHKVHTRREIAETKDGIPQLTEDRFLDVAATIGGFGIKHTHYTHEFALAIAQKAYQLGADTELEACCEWLEENDMLKRANHDLRAARRPKPPSLREQALEALNRQERGRDRGALRPEAMADADIIRRALEALPE